MTETRNNTAHPPSTRRDSTAATVVVRGLTKRYGLHKAVDELTLTLAPGTITGFLGPNGAGKSTTMRILLGLVQATSGDALVSGTSYKNLDEPARHVGAMLESGDFDQGRSGRNHLRALALAIGVPRSRVEELLEVVGLQPAADRTVGTYSLGMRQRLGVAGALLGDPQVLILDEPANGLDPQGVHWLRGFLRQFADKGGTVLISSHVLSEVALIADSVVILHRGRLVATLGPAELADTSRSLEDVYLELTTEELS